MIRRSAALHKAQHWRRLAIEFCVTCSSDGAQVRSRFAEGSGESENFDPFLAALQGLGFTQKSVDTGNSHFVIFELQKAKASRERVKLKALSWPQLKPCAYKRR